MSGSDSSRRSRGSRSSPPESRSFAFSISAPEYIPKRSSDSLPSPGSTRNTTSSSDSRHYSSKYDKDKDDRRNDYYTKKNQMIDPRRKGSSSGDNNYSRSSSRSILDGSRESSIHLKSLGSSGNGSGSGSRRNSTESKAKDKERSSKRSHEFLEPSSQSSRSKKKSSSKKHSGESKKSKSKSSPFKKQMTLSISGISQPTTTQSVKSPVGAADESGSNSSGGEFDSTSPNSPMTPPNFPNGIDNDYVWGTKFKRPLGSTDYYYPSIRPTTPEVKRFKRFGKKFTSPDAVENKRFAAFKDYFNRFGKMREYGAHGYKVHSVGWNCDGRRLASGSCDKTVALFTLDGFKLKLDHTFRGHTDSVDQLRWHPRNPDVLGTASGDKTVKIWDARDERNVESYTTAGENINIAWSPEGNEIAVGNKDDLITFFDVRAGKPIRDELYKFEVNEICWNPKGDEFILTNGDGCIFIHDYPSMTAKQVIKAHPSNCICIEFDRGGKYFAVGAADAVVSLWDYKEMCCVRTFSRLDWPVRTISFNYDGTLIASGSEDLQIDVAQVSTGEQVMELNVDAPTFTVAWHPSRNLLAYAGDDKNKYERDRDKGTIRLFGLPSE